MKPKVLGTGCLPSGPDNPDFYTPQGWIKTPIMQSGNVEKKYNKVCKGVDELLAKHGYVHKGNVFEVKKPNHDTIVLFCHFGVECVILSHIFGCSPMVLWHNFVALPYFGYNSYYGGTGRGHCRFQNSAIR